MKFSDEYLKKLKEEEKARKSRAYYSSYTPPSAGDKFVNFVEGAFKVIIAVLFLAFLYWLSGLFWMFVWNAFVVSVLGVGKTIGIGGGIVFSLLLSFISYAFK